MRARVPRTSGKPSPATLSIKEQPILREESLAFVFRQGGFFVVNTQIFKAHGRLPMLECTLRGLVCAFVPDVGERLSAKHVVEGI